MDLIDREQTIEKVEAVAEDWSVGISKGSYWAGFSLGVEIAINTISNDVPSAEKTGEWIKEPDCMFRCSVCGNHYPSIIGYMRYKFCPNCGARMATDESTDRSI